MADTQPSIGGEPSRFTSTVWTRLRLAQQGDRSAWSQSYLQYRRPLVSFLERRLPKSIDAELLADEVVELILAREFLERADEGKGRFRDLLLAVARYQMANAKRKVKTLKVGGDRKQVSFEDVLPYLEGPDAERKEFAAFYVKEVLDAARELHRKDCRERKSPEAELMDMRFVEGLTQPEIAERVGRTLASVNTLLSRGRDRLKMWVREVLCPFSTGEDDLAAEVRYLLSLAARRKPGK